MTRIDAPGRPAMADEVGRGASQRGGKASSARFLILDVRHLDPTGGGILRGR